jgi:hypothetical protein
MARDLIIADSALITPRKVFGEEITILADHAQTGSYEIYVHDAPEGVGPPPHSHPWDEAFYVIEGKVDFVCGDVAKTVHGRVCACSGRNGSYVPIRQPRASTGHHFGQRSRCDVHCYRPRVRGGARLGQGARGGQASRCCSTGSVALGCTNSIRLRLTQGDNREYDQ